MTLLGAIVPGDRRPAASTAVRAAAGEGAKYPRLMARYVETVLEPRRGSDPGGPAAGIAAGELRPDLDVDAALFMLTGAVVVRRGHEQRAIPPDYPERVVDELLRAPRRPLIRRLRSGPCAARRPGQGR